MDGYDKSKNPTWGSDKNDEDDNDPISAEIISFSDCLNEVVKILGTQGFKLVPEIGGMHCGYSLYHMISGLCEDGMRGVKVPDKFWRWDIVKAGSRHSTRFQNVVKLICENQITKSSNKEEKYTYKRIAQCFKDRLADSKTEVARIAQGFYQTLVEKGNIRETTLTGSSGSYKVIPPLEWFPDEVQKINPRDLLTLYPDAEADQMMLILGRLAVGESGVKTKEGRIDHTFRSYAISVGREAGLGKSTLHNYIIDATQKLGYVWSTLHCNDTKFGWGSIAQSDGAFADDLTDETQKRLIKDVRVKSVVSNGILKVEEKSQPAVSVKARTVIFCCANNSNYAHYMGMDSGSISRLNQLDTYSEEELQDKWGEGRIKNVWEKYAKDLDISTDTLAAYLFRRCADYFLDTIGYHINQDGLCYPYRDSVLEEKVKANRKNFRIDTNLDHAEELPRVASHIIALAIANEVRQKPLLDKVAKLDFSPDLLLLVINFFLDSKKSPPLWAKDLLANHISWDITPYVKAKHSTFQTLSNTKSCEAAFAYIAGELKSNKGFGYPSKSSHYQNAWEACKRRIPKLVREYADFIADEEKEIEIPDYISAITGQAKSFMMKLTA